MPRDKVTNLTLRAGKFTKTRVAWWGNLAVKCALTLVAVSLLATSFDLVGLWYKIHPVARRSGDSPAAPGGVTPVSSASQNHPAPWPPFFGSENAPVQDMSVNGVEVLNQAWVTSVEPKGVIDFYRQQMTARGWQDVTEETFEIKPESRNSDLGNNSLQDPQYVKKYSRTIDSNLALRRGDWSFQIAAFPNDQGNGQTRVSVCAAATPSLEGFVSQLASSYNNDGAHGGQPLEIIRRNGGNSYHMTMATQSASPAQAFQEALAKLGAQGWHQAMTVPTHQTRSGIFAWMTRGKQNAALSVTVSPHGDGASVSFFEITPQ